MRTPQLNGMDAAVQDEDKEWQVTLKDKTIVHGGDAKVTYEELQFAFQRDPKVVQQLFELAIGERTDVPKTVKRDWLITDGLRPTLRAVLLNSVSRTSEGIQLNDPFEGTAENRHVLETLAEARRTNVPRYLRHILGDDHKNHSSRDR